jgi:hypothetical protein
MTQPFPRRVDGVLNPLHVATFASEDVNSPIRLEHFIDLIFNFNFGHILTAGEKTGSPASQYVQALVWRQFLWTSIPPNGMRFKPKLSRIVPVWHKSNRQKPVSAGC